MQKFGTHSSTGPISLHASEDFTPSVAILFFHMALITVRCFSTSSHWLLMVVPSMCARQCNIAQAFSPPGYVSNPCPLRPNLDGVRAQSPADQEHWRGWCQLYRDGKVEGVCVGYVTVSGDRRILNEFQFRYDIFAAVPAYVNGLANLGFNPPYAVAISLLNADHSIISHQLNPKAYLDSHIASFEPVLIETASLTGSWHSALQSIFDQLWNGYGFSMCHPYP